MSLSRASNHSIVLSVNQVAVIHLDKEFLWMSISITAIRLEEQIKTHSIYGTSTGYRHLVMLANVSGTLVRSPTESNVSLRKTCNGRDIKSV